MFHYFLYDCVNIVLIAIFCILTEKTICVKNDQCQNFVVNRYNLIFRYTNDENLSNTAMWFNTI